MSESRDTLIQNAVKFLQDPSVQSSPVSSRITFLEKKGLHAGEIDQALAQAGLQRPASGEGDGRSNTGSTPLPTPRSAPTLPATGPSNTLRKLATSEGLSWSRLTLYVAVASGAMAALKNTSVSVCRRAASPSLNV